MFRVSMAQRQRMLFYRTIASHTVISCIRYCGGVVNARGIEANMYTIAAAACTLECVYGVRGEEGCIQGLVGTPEG